MRPTGHIRQRSSKSFEIRYSLGADKATGKDRYATATVIGTRKDAERELRRRLRTLDVGEHVDPNRITLGKWLAGWLATVRGEVAPKSYERYAEVVDGYLTPALGNLPLSKLTPTHIQNAYNVWAAGGRRDGNGRTAGASHPSAYPSHSELRVSARGRTAGAGPQPG